MGSAESAGACSRLEDLAQQRADLVADADRGDDAQLAARRRLDFLQRLVALELVEWLTGRNAGSIIDQPARQNALVHRKADLRHENLGAHWRGPFVSAGRCESPTRSAPASE